MDKIIEKLIRKYFEHLLKNKWMKEIIEIPIDNQKELVKLIHYEINVTINDIILSFEDSISSTEEIIKDYIEKIDMYNQEKVNE